MKVSFFDDVMTPCHALAIAIIERAQLDAKRGDLGALAWLLHTGIDWAEALTPGAGGQIVDFVARQIEKANKEELKTTWGLY